MDVPITKVELIDSTSDAPAHRTSRVLINDVAVLIAKDGVELEMVSGSPVVTLRLLPATLIFSHAAQEPTP